MISEVLISATVGLLMFIIINILLNFYEQHKLNQFFRRVTPKLPVPYELISIFGGHVRSIFLNKRNLYIIDELHKKYGKSYGYYFGRQPVVATTDLDLLKKVLFDEPYKNTNRIKFNLPFEEFGDDSIGTAWNEKWHRLRKVISPIFT